jgi:dipeptidyl aminopeptidase/acylaminoacyl peptidase
VIPSRPSWADLEAADPALAATARSLLERSGTGEGLLATVRDGHPPRIHPVNVAVLEGRLLTVVLAGSAKAADLEADGRFALHAHQDPAVPHELLVRGHATAVADPAFRARVAAVWAFTVPPDALVVELAPEHVLLGERAAADAWPPAYRSVRP